MQPRENRGTFLNVGNEELISKRFHAEVRYLSSYEIDWRCGKDQSSSFEHRLALSAEKI